MKITKSNNQYYGKYFERAICSVINNEPFVNLTNFNFPPEDIEKMNSDAKICSNIFNAKNALWIGNYTSTQSGDILLDGKNVEIKYVSGGKGTYLNTSLEYFSSILGFVSYKEYMKPEVYPFLEPFFGKKIYDNISPVSQQQSKDFRKNFKKEYEILVKLDKKARTKYVSDLYEFLLNNPEKLSRFISDCISKEISNKTAPYCLVIFNYNTQKVEIINKATIEDLKNNKIFTKNNLSLNFGNFRASIGWQNGAGLNNPTIRVFIK